MAKAGAPPSTYVTGFCAVGRHERCPAIIKADANLRVWDCACRCHAEGNTGWEPMSTGGSHPVEDGLHISVEFPLEAFDVETMRLVFGDGWDMCRLLGGLREVLMKLDTDE